MHLKVDPRLTHYVVPLLVLSLAAGAAVGLMHRAALPQWRTILANTSAESYYRSLLLDGEGFRMLRAQYRERERLLYDKLAQLKGGYEDLLEVSQFIQLVYDAAWKIDRDNFAFTRTLPREEIDGPITLQCPVIFEIQTTYSALGELVAFLERIPHIARIDGIAVVLDENQRMNATLSVTAFIKKAPGGGT